MQYKEFIERYADRNWDDVTMRNRYERMMEQLTPLEILQAIPLFPEAIGVAASSGSGSASSSGGAGGYTSGEGWGQWNDTNWTSITLNWSELN